MNGGLYSDPKSGKHDKHVNGEGISCTTCHDTGKLAPLHFNDYGDNTTGSEARQTVDPSGAGITYNSGTNTCTGSCHGKNHDNKNW